MATAEEVVFLDVSGDFGSRMESLKAQGFVVNVVDCAENLWQLLANRQITLVILDNRFEDIRQVCAEMRSNGEFKKIPVLLFGQEVRSIEIDGSSEGADDIVSRTEDENSFMLRVSSLVEKSKNNPQVIERIRKAQSHPRVLIVSLDQELSSSMAAELYREGFDITEVKDVDDACNLFFENSYSCCVFDVDSLPTAMTDICQQLKDIRTVMKSSIGILFVADKRSAEIEYALAMGIDDFTARSSDPAFLKARVRKLIQQRQAEEENNRMQYELKERELQMLRLQAETKARKKLMNHLQEANDELKLMSLEAERHSNYKGRFLTKMSRDFHKPLQVIVSQLEQCGEEQMSPAVSGIVEQVKQASQSLASVMDDVFDLSSLQAGKFTSESRTFNLGLELSAVLDMFEQRSSHKQVEIGFCLAPGMPEELQGDAKRIRQVLINLVSNAIKYTPGGTVEIQASIKDLQNSEWELRIDVIDSGCGIAPEKIPNLFKGMEAESDSAEGRLGLAFAKQFLDQLQGTIDVSSEVGKGSHFWFTVKVRSKQYKEFTLPKSLALVTNSDLLSKTVAQQLASWQGKCQVLNLDEFNQMLSSQKIDFDIVVFEDVSQPLEIKKTLQQLKIESCKPYILASRLWFDSQQFESALHIHKPLTPLKLSRLLQGTFHSLQKNREPHSKSSREKKKVLVVDDNAINRKVAGMMVQKYGYDFEEAESGFEAIKMVMEESFDIVLMDGQMPECDGYEATRRIRQWEQECNRKPIYIVGLTASIMENSDADCLAAGMDKYVAKPIRFAALCSLFQEIDPSSSEQNLKESEESNGLDEDLIDHLIINELISLADPTDPHFVFNQIKLFESRFSECQIDFRKALAAGDCQAISSVSHNLGGASGVIGIPPLVTLCREIEAHAKNDNLIPIPELIKKMVSIYQQALEKLYTHCKSATPDVSNQGSSALQGRTLLIVDDEEISLRKSTLYFRAQGAEVVTLTGGSEVLDVLKNGKFDAVLLDLGLPDIDGFTLLENMRQEYTPLELPVVILTLDHDPQTITKALAQGANDYVVKPINVGVTQARLMTQIRLKDLSIKIMKNSQKAAIGSMIVTYNHEINNPLQILVSAITLAQKDGSMERLGTAQKALDRIVEIMSKIRKALDQDIEFSEYTDATQMVNLK